MAARSAPASSAPPRASRADGAASDAAHPPAVPPFPARRGAGLVESFRHAGHGLLHAVVHQRNMRVHVVSAILVGLVGSGIPLGLAEKVTMLFCVMLVFFAEILNTALETLVDLAIQQFDEKARVVKDAAAAGVLVLALGTVVIFAAILVVNWHVVTTRQTAVLRQAALGVPLAVAAALLIVDRARPALVDVALVAATVALWLATLPGSESYVFSTLTLALIGLCALTKRARRRAAA